MPVNILGISAYYHDSAACLVRDGRIVAAAQEERFTRIKHDFAFPGKAIAWCLASQGLAVADLALVAFYDKPFIKFERILESYLTCAPRGLRSFLQAIPLWLKQKLFMGETLRRELGFEGKIIFPEHHESHAASAFYPSPFPEAAILTVDGVGEWATTTVGAGHGNTFELLFEQRFPHSLGLLYSAFTCFTGFKVNSGEYKLMGLAPYGEPRYADLIRRELIDLKEDGSFRLNLDYFDYIAGLRMTNARFDSLFGGPPRKPESPITRRELDLARSIQLVTEEAMLRLARSAHASDRLGNRSAWPAGWRSTAWPMDASRARGHSSGSGSSRRPAMPAARWGRRCSPGTATWAKSARPMERTTGNPAATWGRSTPTGKSRSSCKRSERPAANWTRTELPSTVAGLIAAEQVIGLFQGPMEFGPRALGGRSIIGDARSPRMQRVMNLKIKFRESFRPFAPSVLAEEAADWFGMDCASPYMLLVAEVAADKRVEGADVHAEGLERVNQIRSVIPAVTHVDYSARVQTVHRETNPLYYEIIRAFHERTGCPVIINTSFNVRGEPIVMSPEQAYRCFMRTRMDYLVLGSFLLDKREQPPWPETDNWKETIVPD